MHSSDSLELIATIPALFRDRSSQAVVELALRQQLAIYAHRNPRPRLSSFDRAFWVALFRFWSRWKTALVLVQPETVVRWHREGFRLYWRWISKSSPGRPRIDPELRMLIRRMARENGWRARRIQAELEKLGFDVSVATGASLKRRLSLPAPLGGKATQQPAWQPDNRRRWPVPFLGSRVRHLRAGVRTSAHGGLAEHGGR